MRRLLFPAIAAAALAVRAETINLHDHGRLSLFAPEGWKVTVDDNLDVGCNITIEPRGEANASCKISIVYPEEDRLDTKEKLRAEVVRIGREQYAGSSVERRASAREFFVKHGYGYYCNFTDRDLVGRPPEKGNFKVVSSGAIHLAHDVLLVVTIFADDFKGEDYQTLLGIVEGLELVGARDYGRV